MRAPAANALVLALLVAGCGGGAGSQPTAASTGKPPGEPPAATTNTGTGGGAAKGYDCPTLLTPAELDTASGLKGGTVVTNRRGDQGSPGEVLGVTECGIAYDSASTWFGHFSVFAGPEASQNFTAGWDIQKSQGATSLDGVGSEAIQWTGQGTVGASARGSNGVGVSIGIAWDSETTTEAAVKAAAKQILATVLPRT